MGVKTTAGKMPKQTIGLKMLQVPGHHPEKEEDTFPYLSLHPCSLWEMSWTFALNRHLITSCINHDPGRKQNSPRELK